MKNYRFSIIFVAFLNIFFLISPKMFAQKELWTVGTARTVLPNRLEIGIFNPAQYGINQSTELNSYLLAFPVSPNFGVKKYWITIPWGDILFATRHMISIPTPALRIAKSMKLDSGLIRSGQIPWMVGFTNEILLSKFLAPKTSCYGADKLLTLKLGIKKAFGTDTAGLMAIDRPIYYQQTSPYRDTLLWYVGLDFDAHLSKTIDYSIDIEFQSLGFKIYHYEIEHKAMLLWQCAENVKLAGGYIAGFGTYSAKNRFFIYPFIDLVATFNLKSTSDIKEMKKTKIKKKKVKNEKGLFEKGMI